MLITTANLDALRVQFEMRFNEAYGDTEVWAPKLATAIPSSTKQNVYGWVAQQTKMREWIGPRQALNLTEHDYTLVNQRYEATIELDRDEIEDDNLGLFTSVTVPQLAQAAKKHNDQLLKTLLQSNSEAGPAAFDGLSLFNDAHPTFDEDGTTYDNNFSLALTSDNLFTVWSTMAAYTGEDGEPLGIIPNTLVVPPQLYRTALEIVRAGVVARSIENAAADSIASAAIDNVMQGWMDVVMIPEFANIADRWYVADTSKPLKPLIVQNRRSDQFVARDNPQDPKVFDQAKFTYGVDNRKNVGVTLPFLIATSKP